MNEFQRVSAVPGSCINLNNIAVDTNSYKLFANDKRKGCSNLLYLKPLNVSTERKSLFLLLVLFFYFFFYITRGVLG